MGCEDTRASLSDRKLCTPRKEYEPAECAGAIICPNGDPDPDCDCEDPVYAASHPDECPVDECEQEEGL